MISEFNLNALGIYVGDCQGLWETLHGHETGGLSLTVGTKGDKR